jgi:hypothetical protein
MSRTVSLDPRMGVQVLDFLGKYANLPASGIVAGQSVASALDAVFGRHAPVINDIDIFRRVRSNGLIGANKVNKTARRHKLGEVDLQRGMFWADYTGMNRMLSFIDTYSIQSVSRDGLLNFVNCTAANESRQLTAGKILSGFDLNCVRVGVDLESRQLVWDRQFERFLSTRQLEISMLHTPHHTMLRFIKKLQELPGVYGDLDAAAEICAGITQCKFLGQLGEAVRISMKFGSKMHEMARRFDSVWSPYFQETQHDYGKKRGGDGSGWVEFSGPDHTACGPAEQDWDGAEERVSLWSLDPRGSANSAVQGKMDRLGAAVLNFGPQVVYEARRKKRNAIYVKLDALKKTLSPHAAGFAAVNMDWFSTGYVEGHAIPDIALKVEKFVGKHSRLGGPFMGLALGEQYETMKRINKVCKEFDGLESLGVLEQHCTEVDLHHEAFMRAILIWDKTESSKPFDIVPMTLPKLPSMFKGFTVRELLTAGELRREGKDMTHCVGGYASHVRDNLVRVLQIRRDTPGDKSEWSTVELRDERAWRDPAGQGKTAFGRGARLTVAQHRGRFNDPPAETNSAVLAYLVGMYGKSGLDIWLLRTGIAQAVEQLKVTAIEGMSKPLESICRRLSSLERHLKAASETKMASLKEYATCRVLLEQCSGVASARPSDRHADRT